MNMLVQPNLFYALRMNCVEKDLQMRSMAMQKADL